MVATQNGWADEPEDVAEIETLAEKLEGYRLYNSRQRIADLPARMFRCRLLIDQSKRRLA
jgi:hypothetical protein